MTIQRQTFSFAREMSNGERVLWQGSPISGLVMRKADWKSLPFALVWSGAFIVTFLFIGNGFYQQSGYTAVLIGFLFFIVSFYTLLGKHFLDATVRKNTLYALTKDRVIIRSGIFKKSLESINLLDIKKVELIEESHGRGSLIFKKNTSIFNFQNRTDVYGVPSIGTPMFDMVENVRQVYDRIVRAQEDAKLNRT